MADGDCDYVTDDVPQILGRRGIKREPTSRKAT
jgi:hypothetical protein